MNLKLKKSACLAATLAFTQWPLDAQINAARQKLEGVWIATITRVNPPAGTAPTFASLMSYFPGGGYVESSSTGRTNRGPAFGEWVRTGNRQFTITQYFFRFGANEQFAGVSKVVRKIVLSEDGNEFRGVAVQDQYDTQGNLIASGLRTIEAGRRIDLGEISDEP
jgi:hypothetical protein